MKTAHRKQNRAKCTRELVQYNSKRPIVLHELLIHSSANYPRSVESLGLGCGKTFKTGMQKRSKASVLLSRFLTARCSSREWQCSFLPPFHRQMAGERTGSLCDIYMQDATNRQRCCARSRNSLPHYHKKAKSSNSWQEVNKQTLLSFHISHTKMPHLPLLRLKLWPNDQI